MPLPTIFANLTAATGAELDNNFAALGALTLIPCNVLGSANALVLTPLTTTPTQSSYANYVSFLAIAASTNTGAATANVAALGAKNIYKDLFAGPTLLTGGEIAANTMVILTYDSTLNSGAGGFHLQSQVVAFSATPVVGSSARLVGTPFTGGSYKTATWTASELVAETALGGSSVKGVSVSTAFVGTVTGAGGMDTGTIPSSSQLAVYAIYNPTLNTWAALGQSIGAAAQASLTYTGSNLPSGYIYSTLMFVGQTDGSGNMQFFGQRGNKVYTTQTNVVATVAATANVYATVSLSAIVPYSATGVWGTVGGTSVGVNTAVAVAASLSGTAGLSTQYFAASAVSSSVVDGFAAAGQFTDLPMLVPQTLYWKSSNTTQTNVIQIDGYSF
jgi:hypothetical protein